MIVDRRWAVRNLGIDPVTTPPPATTYALGAKPQTDEDFQREIIDFDSEAPHGQEFLAFSSRATGLSRFTDIKWPRGLAPRPGRRPAGGGAKPLPRADVLVVTWTVDEGHALSRVITPGFDSRNDWVPYTHNYAALARQMVPRSLARQARRLGTYWTMQIGTKKVVCFKSDLRMSQDGPKLPNRLLWRQIIEEVRPKLVITTGTSGGIGKTFEVGDVIVSSYVRFDCIKKFKREPFAKAQYHSKVRVAKRILARAEKLFKYNSARLPPDNTRNPKNVLSGSVPTGVVTTDFFGFDNSTNTYKLQGLADLYEMGDAVLGLVPRDGLARAALDRRLQRLRPGDQREGDDAEAAGPVRGVDLQDVRALEQRLQAITCWSLIAAE